MGDHGQAHGRLRLPGVTGGGRISGDDVVEIAAPLP